MSGKERGTLIAAAFLTILSGALSRAHANDVVVFVITGVTLALLASLVGQATEHLGSRLSAGATGVLQSALGNLPELFIGIFSLRAGLITVVQSALIGSILANSLLVLGVALIAGGWKNGTQTFGKEAPRLIVTLSALAVAALIFPTLAQILHTPAAAHTGALSLASAVVLLLVFLASIPVLSKSKEIAAPIEEIEAEPQHTQWPLWLAMLVLVIAGLGAAFVSDWFVDALRPATKALGLSEAFTGLVIVAIAGNAVENVIGVQLAIRNKMDYALSVILNSSLQVALCLIPILVLLSYAVSRNHLSLVLSPLLIAALGVTTLISAMIVYDGESNWMEGVALIGLYGIIAAAFWWG
ncbi:MAG TPA: calcium/proton exchanger [Chthonomonadaceae bacterium]|nr:calcium/proton exchanger [Chthonomonadaceae bacterium]